MIFKASQRGGGQDLATHLLNRQRNEENEIAEIRGAAANDLHGAFREWQACSKVTKCRKYLYHLSVSPDPRESEFTAVQYLDYIARAEKHLGLDDQPRAIVFHVKDGRRHAHIVWSRIDRKSVV